MSGKAIVKQEVIRTTAFVFHAFQMAFLIVPPNTVTGDHSRHWGCKALCRLWGKWQWKCFLCGHKNSFGNKTTKLKPVHFSAVTRHQEKTASCSVCQEATVHVTCGVSTGWLKGLKISLVSFLTYLNLLAGCIFAANLQHVVITSESLCTPEWF